jgi:hypothetical protein
MDSMSILARCITLTLFRRKPRGVEMLDLAPA